MTYARSRAELAKCFRLWGVTDWELASKAERKTAPWNQDEDTRAVHLRYVKPTGEEVRLSYNAQGRAQDNLRVLFLAVDSMRLNEVRGIDGLIREAYAQLPPPATAGEVPYVTVSSVPWVVLGIATAKLVANTRTRLHLRAAMLNAAIAAVRSELAA